MNNEVILNKELFYKRVNKIAERFPDPLTIMLGKRADVEEFALNSAIFNYLLGFEFSETVIVIKKTPIIFTSHKKAMILSQLGDGIKIVKNNMKEDPHSLEQFLSSMNENYSILDRESIKGDFCNMILNSIRFKEVTEDILRLFVEKEEDEITNVHKAGVVANHLIKHAIEMCRDEEFSREAIERHMNDKLKGIDPNSIEFAESPEHCSTGVRLIVRYRGYCAEIGRPFLTDLTAEYEIQKYALSLIKVGSKSADILQAVTEFAEERGISSKIKIHSIGLMAKELNFKMNFEINNLTAFVIKIGSYFANTFVLEDVPMFITLKDTPEEYSVARMKFRNKTNEHEMRVKIKEHQKELLDKLILDMGAYYKAHGSEVLDKLKSSKLVQYTADSSIPRNKKIHIDYENYYVIIPILSYSVPYHISLIKNVAVSANSKLRINFKESKEIREICGNLPFNTTIKSISITINNADEILAAINELKRDYNKPKIDVKEAGILKEKTKRTMLLNLLMKTDHKLASRKNTGNLELHENGFKYMDTHFLFSNIRSIFYQLGDFEDAALIHFNFKEPMLIGDKPTTNLQFHKKQGVNYQDTTKRENEHMAMMRQQEEEDELYRTNRELSLYIERIENETSFRPQLLQKGFVGVYHKEATSIAVTNDCLVSVNESPFFILHLEEVEIINLERVTYATKTFDCVFIFKDKSKAPFTIGAIETTRLQFIKTTFDSMNLVFMETKFNINWNNLMSTIMRDPVGFYETGGWTELLVDEPEPESSSDASEDDSIVSSTVDSDGDESDSFGEEDSSDAESESLSSEETSSFVESDSDDHEDAKRRRRR